MTARRLTGSKCEHTAVRRAARLVMTGMAYECEACGAIGAHPLGPSNDDSDAVRIEIRAAELEETEYWEPNLILTMERWGIEDGEDPDGEDPDGSSDARCHAQWLAGWLSVEIEKFSDRDFRDADAWSWDISRPIAEQLAETAADDAAADAIEAQAAREEVRSAANTAALVADLNARGPAYDALNDAMDEDDDAAGVP